MSTRIYVYEDTNERINTLAKRFQISKAQIIEIAVNDYYRKIQEPLKNNERVKK